MGCASAETTAPKQRSRPVAAGPSGNIVENVETGRLVEKPKSPPDIQNNVATSNRVIIARRHDSLEQRIDEWNRQSAERFESRHR
jgi:hypothetical protein